MRLHWTTLIGVLAATLTTSAYFPQVVKTLKTKETKDLSLLMLIILSTGIFLWFVYGLLLNDFPIIIANGITFILSLTILALKIKHG